MFLEPRFYNDKNRGWIEVICGPMFSGKTEELIRRMKRAEIASQKTIIFKPSIDVRYSIDKVVSHNAVALPSISIDKADDILQKIGKAQVVGIDEAQFFNLLLVRVCEILAKQGKRVIVSGLDMDYKGRPFSPIPELMAVSEYVTKIQAVCVRCGAQATHTFRLADSREDILVGDKKEYESRCRHCFNQGLAN